MSAFLITVYRLLFFYPGVLSRVAAFSWAINLPTLPTRLGLARLSSINFMTALPTITPSTHDATDLTCSGEEIPNPTAIGILVRALIFWREGVTSWAILSLSPVTPIRET